MEALKEIANFGALNGDFSPDACAVRLSAHASLRRDVSTAFSHPFGPLWLRCAEDPDNCWAERDLMVPGGGFTGRVFTKPPFPARELREYRRNMNRVSSTLRLSEERYQLLNEWAKHDAPSLHIASGGNSGMIPVPLVSLRALREGPLRSGGCVRGDPGASPSSSWRCVHRYLEGAGAVWGDAVDTREVNHARDAELQARAKRPAKMLF